MGLTEGFSINSEKRLGPFPPDRIDMREGEKTLVFKSGLHQESRALKYIIIWNYYSPGNLLREAYVILFVCQCMLLTHITVEYILLPPKLCKHYLTSSASKASASVQDISVINIWQTRLKDGNWQNLQCYISSNNSMIFKIADICFDSKLVLTCQLIYVTHAVLHRYSCPVDPILKIHICVRFEDCRFWFHFVN